jgi:hypothetical protein
MIASGRLLVKKLKKKKESIKLYFPLEASEIIQAYLSDDNKSAKFYFTPSKTKLFFFGCESLLLAKVAAYHVLYGNPTKAETIITKNPDTLLHRIEQTAPNGTIVKGTLYQLILWADDDYIRNKRNETYIEMIKHLLITNHGSENEAKQREKQFQGWNEKSHLAADRSAFHEISRAFDKSKVTTETQFNNDTKLQAAIKKFKNHFKPEGPIIFGKNCAPQLWDYACLFYAEEKFRAYGGYGSIKNLKFCELILGTIDLNLPAWAVQVLQTGAYSILRKHSKVSRSNVESCFDTSPTSKLRLGDNHFMSIFGRDDDDGPIEIAQLSRMDGRVWPYKNPLFTSFQQQAKLSTQNKGLISSFLNKKVK